MPGAGAAGRQSVAGVARSTNFRNRPRCPPCLAARVVVLVMICLVPFSATAIPPCSDSLTPSLHDPPGVECPADLDLGLDLAGSSHSRRGPSASRHYEGGNPNRWFQAIILVDAAAAGAAQHRSTATGRRSPGRGSVPLSTSGLALSDLRVELRIPGDWLAALVGDLLKVASAPARTLSHTSCTLMAKPSDYLSRVQPRRGSRYVLAVRPPHRSIIDRPRTATSALSGWFGAPLEAGIVQTAKLSPERAAFRWKDFAVFPPCQTARVNLLHVDSGWTSARI